MENSLPGVAAIRPSSQVLAVAPSDAVRPFSHVLIAYTLAAVAGPPAAAPSHSTAAVRDLALAVALVASIGHSPASLCRKPRIAVAC